MWTAFFKTFLMATLLLPHPGWSAEKAESPLITSATDDSDITTRYKKAEAQDVELLKKYQEQLKEMSHPACAAGKFATFSVCFRSMIADFKISSMAAFDMLNILAAQAINLDKEKAYPETLTKEEADAHQLVLELHFIENQIFVLEKINSSDLLVHRMKTNSDAEVEIMASHRLKEKQRYESFWKNAHTKIKDKFAKIYKMINDEKTPAHKTNKAIVEKYTDLYNRYTKVYDGAIVKIFPNKKFN